MVFYYHNIFFCRFSVLPYTMTAEGEATEEK
jgi:hypothetical protein